MARTTSKETTMKTKTNIRAGTKDVVDVYWHVIRNTHV